MKPESRTAPTHARCPEAEVTTTLARRVALAAAALVVTASLSGCGVFCGAMGGSGGGVAGGCGAGMRF